MSHSAFLHERFRRRATLRKWAACAYVVFTLAYLGWRLTILNHDALGLSLAYFSAEAFGFILGLNLIFSSWNYRHRRPQPAPMGLSVDVFVPAYKEPVDLVRWTLIGAREIAYPHETYLLDDGNRPELKALAEEIGVHYLARGNNLHAKAGNLNFGLSHSRADFVMVFDADHVALPEALDLMLGFFRDPLVAMVQTPQDFYNVDAFQYFSARRSGGLWHDQSFFYLIAQSCRDYFNGASCCGTAVVYRRTALDAIGGIPVETVTEDIHTSLKLHKAGYEVVYLNEPVAYGIAATDISDFYRTRHRWGHGNIHALRIENVLFCSELTFGQKLSYLMLGLIYLEGWQQLILFIVPMLSLFLGWAPFEITFLNVLVVLFFPLVTTALLQELGCGLSRIWANEVFSVARFPIHILATAALFVGRMPFRTSTKNVRGRINWVLMTPQLAVLATSLLAVAAGAVAMILNFKVGPLAYAVLDLLSGNWANIQWSQHLPQGYTLELVTVAGAWAMFNAAKSAYLIRKAILDARRSTDDYRFDVRLPLELKTSSGYAMATVEKLSRSWLSARVLGDEIGLPAERFVGRLFLPSGPLPVKGRIVQTTKSDIQRYKLGPVLVELGGAKSFADEGKIECELVWDAPADIARLTRSLHSVNWHREFMHRDAFFLTPSDVLVRLFRMSAPFVKQSATWLPVLYSDTERAEAVGVIGIKQGEAEMSLVAFRKLDSGAVLRAEIFAPEGIRRHQVRILAPEALHSLAVRGLDGAVAQRYRVSSLTDGESVENPALLAAAE
jgi:cellulose synthase (UDP-forming)